MSIRGVRIKHFTVWNSSVDEAIIDQDNRQASAGANMVRHLSGNHLQTEATPDVLQQRHSCATDLRDVGEV